MAHTAEVDLDTLRPIASLCRNEPLCYQIYLLHDTSDKHRNNEYLCVRIYPKHGKDV